MSRKEFSKSVKVSVIKAATRGTEVYCQECQLPTKRFQIDHINPDGLTGQPEIQNAKLLCHSCHAEKTKHDVAHIARAKRIEAKTLGATKKPPAYVKEQHDRVPQKLQQLPRRAFYEDIGGR